MHATQKAFKHIKAILNQQGEVMHQALRVGVEDGGCSGRQYVVKIDEPRHGDIVLEDNGVRIVIDPASYVLLKDCQLDFSDSLADTGFKIHNPTAKRSCGCGRSFEV